MSSQWRRQAKLVVYVPKCGRIGVRGGLAGFKIEGVNAPVTVVGEGDRDYEASYEVSKLTGSLSADNIAIHRLDGVKGDVSIVATAYAGNTSTVHDDRGITIEPGPIRSAEYQNIDGNLRVRFVRTDLTVGRVSGRIDVENDFGHTTWLAETSAGQARSSDRLARRPDRGAARQVGAGRASAGSLHRMRYRPARSRHETGPGRLQLLVVVGRRSLPLLARLRHRRARNRRRVRAFRSRRRRAPRPTPRARRGHHQPRRGDSLAAGSAVSFFPVARPFYESQRWLWSRIRASGRRLPNRARLSPRYSAPKERAERLMNSAIVCRMLS